MLRWTLEIGRRVEAWQVYSEMVIKHFTLPQNVGYMPCADGLGMAENQNCSDKFVIFIRVCDEIIVDSSFLVFGCGPAIASASMTTTIVKGKSIKEALEITDQDIIDALGGLPEHKRHCSNLGIAALRSAIENYLVKNGLSLYNYRGR